MLLEKSLDGKMVITQERDYAKRRDKAIAKVAENTGDTWYINTGGRDFIPDCKITENLIVLIYVFDDVDGEAKYMLGVWDRSSRERIYSKEHVW